MSYGGENGTTADKVVSFGYKWKCPVQKLVGERFEQQQLVNSPEFLVVHNGICHKFCIVIYPAGAKAGCMQYRTHMGLAIHLCDGLVKTVMVKVTKATYWTDMDSQHKPINFVWKRFKEVQSGQDKCSPKAIAMVGKDEKHETYVQPFGDCNTVTFHFVFSFPESIFNAGKCLVKPLTPTDDSALTLLYTESLTNPRASTVDFTLVCRNGVKVHVHKGILAVLSTVFGNLFGSNLMRDAESPEIKVETLKSEVVRELVQFAYLKAPSAGMQHNDLVIDVLKVAHVYDVQPLISECERILVNRMIHDEGMHAIQYYCLADRCRLKVLENVCTARLIENWEEFGVADDERLKGHIKTLTEKLVQFSRCHFMSLE